MVYFFCVGKVVKVLRMLVLSQFFLAFGGWHILVYLGLKGLGVFVSLVLFFFCLGFVFVLFCSVCFCLLLVILLLSRFGLFLVCSLCFLEWVRCSYCFVLSWFVFACVCFCLFVLVSFCFL